MAKSRIRLFNQARSAQPQNPVGAAAAPDTVVAKDRSTLFNQLALLFLIMTPLVLIVYLLIFVFPQSPINPLPPIVVGQPVAIIPTAIRTPTPTMTPTRTPHSTNTPTEMPTSTPTATPTAVVTVTVKPGSTRTPLPSATPIVPRTAAPTRSPYNYTANLTYRHHQLYGSNWAGMDGLVFDTNGKPQSNIDVHAWGDPPLGPNGQDVFSGAYADRYGPSGWEFTLSDKPIYGTWHVQLVDDKGNPLSEVVDVVMQGDPLANLANIIFYQNH